MNSANPPNRELLAELLLRWEDLYERGQDTPAEELARDHPDLIAELARRIRALKTVAWIQKPLDDDPPDDEPSQGPADPKTLANRYRLDELIAEGGFARVYRAYDLELQRTVAVKVPKPERLHSGEAFLAEARRVARLKHDGIVAVYDCGLENGSCFIVSEYLDGGSLADRIVKQKPSQEEAIRWVAEVAEALDFAHMSGVVHLDLKPANILIDQHGRAKLADFGIAQSATKTGEFASSLGTLRYMAPEGLHGDAADHRNDIFSLGIVLHEALTGSIPYSSHDPSVLRREITAGRLNCSKNIPKPLLAICRKALSHSPHQRHASATQFAAELRRVGSLRKGFVNWAGVAIAGMLMSISLLAFWKPGASPASLWWQSSPAQKPESSGQIALAGPDLTEHSAAGKYLCFVAGDWEKGLPALAQSDLGSLKGVAAEELALLAAEQYEPERLFELAGKWWVASESYELTAAQQSAVKDHAADLYADAANGLTDMLEKQLANSRLRGRVPQPSRTPVCLADMPVKRSLVGWGRFRMGQLPDVQVNGVVPRTAISAHASSRVVFALPKGFDGTLQGGVGIEGLSQAIAAPSSCRFRILEGDNLLWESGVIHQDKTSGESIVEHFAVRLKGVSDISLEVDSLGANHSDWSIWIDPVLHWKNGAESGGDKDLGAAHSKE